MSHANRYIVITGASTGIGRAAAVHLARCGVQVLAGVRNDTDGAAVAAEGNGNITPLRLDITDPASIAAATTRVEQAVGDNGLWALVNNAGVVVSAPLEFVPLDKLRWQLEVNVTGQVAVTQALLPLIRRAKGRIVFTGSSSGYFAPPFLGPYGASKHAIEAVVDALRRELKPWSIHVSNVQPGAIKTPIWDKSKAAADDVLAGLPETAMQLYGDRIETITALARKRAAGAAPAQIVADAIAHAVLAARPRTRYKVGLDAKGQAVLNTAVPTRIIDWLIGRVIG